MPKKKTKTRAKAKPKKKVKLRAKAKAKPRAKAVKKAAVKPAKKKAAAKKAAPPAAPKKAKKAEAPAPAPAPAKPKLDQLTGGVPAMPLKPREDVPSLNADELKKLDGVLKLYNHDPVYILGMLQDIQDMNNYIPRSWVEAIALKLDIPRTRIYRIATFFKALSLEPRGKHICTICVGTTCHVRGAPKLIDKIERDYDIKGGETTADKNLTMETVGCVGACALGPLIVLDGKYHGHMTTEKMGRVLKKSL